MQKLSLFYCAGFGYGILPAKVIYKVVSNRWFWGVFRLSEGCKMVVILCKRMKGHKPASIIGNR